MSESISTVSEKRTEKWEDGCLVAIARKRFLYRSRIRSDAGGVEVIESGWLKGNDSS
jgi:hypothetical protein